MTPLTAAQVARARLEWTCILGKESPASKSTALAFWASVYGEKLLTAAEILTSLHQPPPRRRSRAKGE